MDLCAYCNQPLGEEREYCRPSYCKFADINDSVVEVHPECMAKRDAEIDALFRKAEDGERVP